MGLTSGGPINWAQVWVYFSWTSQDKSWSKNHTDRPAGLNNKSPLALYTKYVKYNCAVQINPWRSCPGTPGYRATWRGPRPRRCTTGATASSRSPGQRTSGREALVHCGRRKKKKLPCFYTLAVWVITYWTLWGKESTLLKWLLYVPVGKMS